LRLKSAFPKKILPSNYQCGMNLIKCRLNKTGLVPVFLL
jgi:hypothetical protein